MEDDFKRWTAKRKTALILDMIQEKTSVAEKSWAYDLAPPDIEEWVDECKKGMENALGTRPLKITRKSTNGSSVSCRRRTERGCWNCVQEKIGLPAGQRGRLMILELQQDLIARYGHLGRVQTSFLLLSDNGLVFTTRSYKALVKSYGLHQEFITPFSPEQNGMVE